MEKPTPADRTESTTLVLKVRGALKFLSKFHFHFIQKLKFLTLPEQKESFRQKFLSLFTKKVKNFLGNIAFTEKHAHQS